RLGGGAVACDPAVLGRLFVIEVLVRFLAVSIVLFGNRLPARAASNPGRAAGRGRRRLPAAKIAQLPRRKRLPVAKIAQPPRGERRRLQPRLLPAALDRRRQT